MSEAPKCDECPIFPHGNQTECGVAEIREMGYPFPGPQCPFMRLDAKDAEIERLRYRLKATAEKYHARADHGGMFDECAERTCTENDKALSLDNPLNNP